MNKKIGMFLSAACALLLSHGASATTYIFDYTYDGTSVTQNVSAAGSTVAVGDTIMATFHAAGAGYWQAPAGTYLWTPQAFDENGDRIGDLNWTFLHYGSSVDSGATVGELSQYVHIPNYVQTSQAISFDTLTWSYVLTSSSAPVNTLNGFDFGQSYLPGASYVAVVPEPQEYGMLLAGLLTLGALARSKRRS